MSSLNTAAIRIVVLFIVLIVAVSDSCDVTDPLVKVQKNPAVLAISPKEEPYTGGCCQVINKDNVKKPTVVEFSGAKKNTYYLLLMFDPDAPNPAFMHWIVANIKDSDLSAGNAISGDTVLDYYPPSPPGQQQHRYQFYLFEQKEKKNNVEKQTGNSGWTKKKLSDLLKEFSATKPAAAVFQFSAYSSKQCGKSPNCNKCLN